MATLRNRMDDPLIASQVLSFVRVRMKTFREMKRTYNNPRSPCTATNLQLSRNVLATFQCGGRRQGLAPHFYVRTDIEGADQFG